MQGETVITIAQHHPAFAGHFPGQPVVPGVVLLDEAVHAIAAAQGLPFEWYEIASAKFLAAVGPGATLLIRYREQANGTFRFDIESGGRAVANGVLKQGQPAS